MADPRTRPVDIPGLDGPSVQAPTAVPLVAPQETTPPARTGLDGLAQSFASFFGGAAQGLSAVAEATTAAEKLEMSTNYHLQRAEEEKRNKLKAEQAQADALSGKPMGAALKGDFSYAQAYQKAAGEQHGVEMRTQWFTDVYAKAKPGDNLMVLTDEWLKNTWGKGTGNPQYDAAALSTFKAGADRAVMQFSENSVRSVIASGVQMQDANVAADVKAGRIGGTMQAHIDAYRKLDPNNPEKAPLRLAQAIQNSIFSGDPRVAQATLAALEKPGTGINGKSYAESFPAAYGEVQKTLTQRYLHDGSLRGASEYAKAEADLDTAKAKGDPVAITEVMKRLETQIFPQFGGTTRYNALRAQGISVLAQAAKVGVAVNQIDQMVVNGAPIDPKPIDAHLQDYFKAKGIDPRQNPEAAGGIVAKLGVATSSLKADFSQLMLGASPEGQTTALRYFNAINAAYNDPSAAKRFMNDEAVHVYDAVEHQRVVMGDQALPQILERVNQNREALAKANKIEWKTITGDTAETAAMARVDTAINKAVKGTSFLGITVHEGAFSGAGSVDIDWASRQMLRDDLKQAVVLGGARGQTDLQTISDQTFQNAAKSGKLEVVPGEGGTLVVRPNRYRDNTSAVPLSPWVFNPKTRQIENTLSTYQTDLAGAAKQLPGLIDPAATSVAPLPPRGMDGQEPKGAEGVYWLQRNGNRLTVTLGQEIAVTTPNTTVKKLTVPAEPREALQFLQKHLPDDKGLVLVPNSPVDPTAFWVGYRPRLTGQAPKVPTDEEMRVKRQEKADQLEAITPPGLHP